jgi:hypothetical protein
MIAAEKELKREVKTSYTKYTPPVIKRGSLVKTEFGIGVVTGKHLDCDYHVRWYVLLINNENSDVISFCQTKLTLCDDK